MNFHLDCGPNLGLTSDGMQSLANVASNKQMATIPNSVDAQYVQQQSQIFVFSTLMANKGAEMVMQGQFETIISYHMAQQCTKKFMEVSCLKFHLSHHNHCFVNNLEF